MDEQPTVFVGMDISRTASTCISDLRTRRFMSRGPATPVAGLVQMHQNCLEIGALGQERMHRMVGRLAAGM